MKHSLIGNKSECSLDVLIDILPIACILFSEPFSGSAARLLFPLQRLHRNGDFRSTALGARAGGIPDGQDMELPEGAQKPGRSNQKAPTTLLEILRDEQASKRTGGICHKIQIDLIYHSNHIGGKRLTHDQTRDIFETKAPGINDESVNVGDIIETTNHFRRIDMMIDRAPAR